MLTLNLRLINLQLHVLLHVKTIDTGNLTPSGKRKEWDCSESIPDNEKPEGGCRSNNLPICPIPSSNNNAYVTLAGGGLFVAKLVRLPHILSFSSCYAFLLDLN